MSQYWSRLQQREELLHPVTTHSPPHPPPKALRQCSSHTQHTRVGKAREGCKGQERKKNRETLGDPRDICALLFQQDFVLFCSPRLIQRRTWELEQRKRHFFFNFKKRTSVKYPVLHFYGRKTYVFFSISNFSHCFLCFCWCVIVNGHLYVNMKKTKIKY